ncbi:phenazine biosynthesis-like domain-containing protein 1 [Dorcoceras hygrometricum]|uniref:Phenazine biosynthesis-like domain-containing protein 1 n=1 Tax=Dorcoceras hygrometricum TaxID=472368 RepID=A0A2Z7CC51_9LAMI|nr:phenazine biosynthesis-like domain-containing protein 1 [Dorcoceras hygrometricum]
MRSNLSTKSTIKASIISDNAISQSCNACATTQPTITRQCGIQAQRLSWPPHQTALDLSGTTTQPDDHNVQRGNSAFKGNQSQYVCILQQEGRSNQLKSTALAAPQQLNSIYYKFESKAVKEQKNHWSTIAKTYELCNYFALLKSGDFSLQTGINRKP